MKLKQPARILGHAIDQFGRRDAVRIFEHRIEHDPVFFFRQILGDDVPNGGMAETFAELLMEVASPNRVVLAPWVTARHRKRTARWLQTPLCAAHEAACRVRLIKFQTVNVLSPQPVRAPEVFCKQSNHCAERMQHEPLANQARRIRQAVGEL